MKMNFRFIIVFLCSVLILFTIISCNAGTKVPTDVSDAAKTAWEYYKWSEKNFGGWRGGGWHLKPGDENLSFEITQSQKGTLPQELQAAMSISPARYKPEVWCISFKPPLYFGVEPDSGTNLKMENMLFFQQGNNTWLELGQVWNEKWVVFMYDPGVYKVSTNFYMGTTKKMFEMMGCSNWQDSGSTVP
jgi:hypothetical protein